MPFMVVMVVRLLSQLAQPVVGHAVPGLLVGAQPGVAQAPAEPVDGPSSWSSLLSSQPPGTSSIQRFGEGAQGLSGVPRGPVGPMLLRWSSLVREENGPVISDTGPAPDAPPS